MGILDDHKTRRVSGGRLPSPPSSIMPKDHSGRYFLDHPYFGERTVSRMTRNTYDRSRTSNRLHSRPYPSPSAIITRVDEPGNDWFHWPGQELHLRDFVWLARMQTARRLRDRMERTILHRDPVLDRLLEEGTFDRNGEIDTPNSYEELAMGHSSAMANRLLMRIESLEAEVSVCILPRPFLRLMRLSP
jgi:hypothetical protein